MAAIISSVFMTAICHKSLAQREKAGYQSMEEQWAVMFFYDKGNPQLLPYGHAQGKTPTPMQ